ncbi:hypothetical protein [Rubripirellula reticaptiva]|uniref:Uncharacterized protein n=1 Tax=Rubripirellula reticaptiva TaxID=2528013 RepID=A0A5C6ESF9_9BACT|nr:hypothetical protein [Rubripirellula reticaptiva]TWU51250.1 hypothetical protein Poly59_28420 [Rubripirellula reticaptiva]
MTTKTRTDDKAAWNRVREAVTERWPNINRDELHDCPDDKCTITDFVKQQVDASDEEIESVVGEFTPHESIASRVAHTASDTLHQAGESAQFAYMRADECIAKRPTESVITSFVAGMVLGATVTALWFSTRPQTNAWDQIKKRSWG